MLALLPVICAALAVAQAPPNYTAAEAAKHVGETATVTDKVDEVYQSAKGHIFLNMAGKSPNQAFAGNFLARSNTKGERSLSLGRSF